MRGRGMEIVADQRVAKRCTSNVVVVVVGDNNGIVNMSISRRCRCIIDDNGNNDMPKYSACACWTWRMTRLKRRLTAIDSSSSNAIFVKLT